jgi:hypothetical protein
MIWSTEVQQFKFTMMQKMVCIQTISTWLLCEMSMVEQQQQNSMQNPENL